MKIKLIAPIVIIGFSLMGYIGNVSAVECMGVKTKEWNPMLNNMETTCRYRGNECVGYKRKCPDKTCTTDPCVYNCQEFKWVQFLWNDTSIKH